MSLGDLSTADIVSTATNSISSCDGLGGSGWFEDMRERPELHNNMMIMGRKSTVPRF